MSVLSRCWACHTCQLTWSSQLCHVVLAIPILRGGYRDSETTGDSAKSHGWCGARPALHSDVSKCVPLLHWYCCGNEFSFCCLLGATQIRRQLGREMQEQLLHVWYWERCFFLYIPASQSLPWGRLCLTHWAPEEFNSLVGLKKYQGREKALNVRAKLRGSPQEAGSSTLPRRAALCTAGPAAGACFFSCSWFLMPSRSGSRSSRGWPSFHEWAGKALSPTFWYQKVQLYPLH